MDLWFSKSFLVRFFRVAIVLGIITSGLLYLYTWQVVKCIPLNVKNDHELLIVPGTTLKRFTEQLKEEGIFNHPKLLRLYLICSGNTKQIKSGEYKVKPQMTAVELLDVIFQGLVTQYAFTIVEGWQTEQVIAQLHRHPKIKPTLKDLPDREILLKLQIPEINLEGIFLPDTYFFDAYTTDVEFLRRAYHMMQEKAHAAWLNRDPSCQLKSQYEVLILASIIEKETNIKSEYREISGVFNRRLAKKMRLQADPTVLYAIQNRQNGPLFRKDLLITSPYNTYRYSGLPPTPIAIPSAEAVYAAANPNPGTTLYFVANKNNSGSHVFSTTLEDHNKAVKSYRSAPKPIECLPEHVD